MSAPMIDIRGVTKTFGTIQVLNGVDLTVGNQEVVCLIGPSGSGKSTLLRCVNFLESYDSGEIRIDSSWGKSTGSRPAICWGLHEVAHRRSARRP